MEKLTVHILCGLIGSGKSTWAKKSGNLDTVIISKDSIRTMLQGLYVYDNKIEPLVKQIAFNSIGAAIAHNFNIIIDETNLTRDKRKELIEFITDVSDQVEIKIDAVNIVYFTEAEKNVDNRMRSPRGVKREDWNAIYEGMKLIFEEPTESELDGRGSIIKVQI